jgi:RNA polymerase sigma-70 factor (ECF subfamily)
VGTLPDEDVEALVSRCEALRPALVRLGAAVTGDLETGRDLAQDAITAFLSSRVEVRTPDAWLRRVVVLRGRSWVRRQGRARRYLERWEVWRVARSEGRAAAEGPDLADQLAVRQALAGLSPDHRAVLVLRYYDDLSVPEIARTLQVSEGTVKSRLHRGLRRLKEEVEHG